MKNVIAALSLLVVPAVYLLFDRLHPRFAERRNRGSGPLAS